MQQEDSITPNTAEKQVACWVNGEELAALTPAEHLMAAANPCAWRKVPLYTEPPVDRGTLPPGWKAERNEDGSIVINCPLGGVVVRDEATDARWIPETILYELISTLIGKPADKQG